MRAARTGELRDRLVAVARLLGFDRATGFQVNALRPGDLRVRLRREQLAGESIEHVEKAVLRRLHDDFARPAADVELRERHLLDGRVIPLIARVVW